MRKTLALVALLLCAACSTPKKRIAENQELFDTYSPEDQAAIQSGQIRKGFDQNQAYMALGKPTKKNAQGNTESWIWLKQRSRQITVKKDVDKYALERNEWEQGKRDTEPSTEEVLTQSRTQIVKVVNFQGGKIESWEDPADSYTGEWQ